MKHPSFRLYVGNVLHKDERYVLRQILFGISAPDNLDVELDLDTSAKLGHPQSAGAREHQSCYGREPPNMTNGRDVKALISLPYRWTRSSLLSFLWRFRAPLVDQLHGQPLMIPHGLAGRVYGRAHLRDLLRKGGSPCPATALSLMSMVDQTILTNAYESYPHWIPQFGGSCHRIFFDVLQ